jgi:hypothetical protein
MIGRLRTSRALRVVAALLALAVAWAGLVPGAAKAATGPFSDVPSSAYFAPAVSWARAAGVTSGVQGGSRFEPSRTLTRAEAVTFLWRAAGRPGAAPARMGDVPRSAYYAPAVDWAVARGVTTGVAPGRFEPSRTLTRAEAVTFLWRHGGSPTGSLARFVDAVGHWAAPAIGWASAEGVTTGSAGGRFEPSAPVSRAQNVTFLWRSLGEPAGGALTSAPAQDGGSGTAPAREPASDERSVSGFVHPGVGVDGAQLDFVKAKVAAGAQPWKGALDQLVGSGTSVKVADRPQGYRYSSLSYVPAPVRVIQAPSASNQRWIDENPEYGYAAIGDVQHLDDARAAYAQALLWYVTGNQAHADKAIEIMNAWSSTLVEIKFDQPRRPDNNVQVYNNGKLQAGWGGSLFVRAAEIVRHSGAGWSAGDVARFERMLTDVYLPLTITGWTNGANWLMTFAETTMGIGVFTNDAATFEAGVAMWRDKVPTTIYLPSDGPYPKAPYHWYKTEADLKAYWHGPSSWLTGLQGESLRDMSHMAMGMGAMAIGAETARIQGVDLFGEERERLVAGFELQARYVNEYLDEVARLGGREPASTWKPTGWVGSSFRSGGTALRGGWEIAHTHYAVHNGVSMPQTTRLVERLRPSNSGLHLVYDTLTNAR